MPAPVIKVVIYLASSMLSSNLVGSPYAILYVAYNRPDDGNPIVRPTGVVHKSVVRHPPGNTEDLP
jgi:hypothetical protein